MIFCTDKSELFNPLKKKYGRFFFLRVVWKYMWFQNWLFSIFSIIKINSFRSTYINDNFYHFNQPQTIVHTHSIGCLLYSCLDLILKRSTIYLIRLKYTLQIDIMWKNIFEKNLVKCRAWCSQLNKYQYQSN
jgi:hypothetical protein